jgi:hypothetical protein
VECREAAHIDEFGKLELEAINDLLVDGFAGKAAVLLGLFLDHVHVVKTGERLDAHSNSAS